MPSLPGNRAHLRGLRAAVQRHRSPLPSLPGNRAHLPGSGRQFRGHYVRCLACRVSEGTCQDCGRTFIDVPGRSRCLECRATKRTCPGCGRTFIGLKFRCQACRRSQRTCAMCGREHFSASTLCTACWRKSLPPPVQAAFIRRANNARRARKLAAQVSGPVLREVYQAIARSGPCVYCRERVGTVDHVRPLTRGGDEHRSNLVPCSSSCNFSKGPAAHRMGPGPGCLRRRAFAPRRHRTSPLERNRSVCQPRLTAQNPRPSTRAVRWTHTA